VSLRADPILVPARRHLANIMKRNNGLSTDRSIRHPHRSPLAMTMTKSRLRMPYTSHVAIPSSRKHTPKNDCPTLDWAWYISQTCNRGNMPISDPITMVTGVQILINVGFVPFIFKASAFVVEVSQLLIGAGRLNKNCKQEQRYLNTDGNSMWRLNPRLLMKGRGRRLSSLPVGSSYSRICLSLMSSPKLARTTSGN